MQTNPHSRLSCDTSVTALYRALKQLCVTWKNVLPIPINWNTPEVIAARMKYVVDMYSLQSRPLVFIDETWVQSSLQKNKRTERGLQSLPHCQTTEFATQKLSTY